MKKDVFFCAAMLVIAFLFSFSPSLAQPVTDPIVQGIQLYRDGRYKEAINVLNGIAKTQKNNPDLWHFLGMAQHKTNQTKDAVKSFQKAVKLRPNFAPSRISLAVLWLRANKLKEAAREAEQALLLDPKSQDACYVAAAVRLRNGNPEEALTAIDRALLINDKFKEAWLLKSEAWLGVFRKEALALNGKIKPEMPNTQKYAHYTRLNEAASSLETYLKLTQDPMEKEFWREQLDAMSFYAKWAEARRQVSSESLQLEGMSASLRPTIIYRERAQYTSAARDAGVAGIVLLLVTYTAEGELKHLLVIKGLEHGLTQSAVTAARKIKFTPAIKDGRPVSVVGQIEFNFVLY